MKRVCLLTGASGLLGTQFIARYADRYRIAAVWHQNTVQFATQDQRFLDPLVPSREIEANTNAVHAIRADLAEPGEVDRVVDEVSAIFPQVDLLINAAAIRGWSHLLAPGALESASVVFHLNVQAVLRLSIGLARRLWVTNPDDNVRANRNIVNVSSSAGLFVYQDLGQAAYGASKAALNQLTYHLANDFWDIGIRVNAIAPDTFPGRVPIESVLESIVAFDRGTETGKVLPLLTGA